MKTRILTLAGATLTLALSAPATAQTTAAENRMRSSGGQTISVAPPDSKERGVRKLQGREVTGSDGARLGRIEDVAFDPQSGKTYAVVGTGGVLGVGEKLRLVTFDPAKNAVTTSKTPLTVPVDQATWMQRATIDARQFKDGQWSLSDEQWRALSATDVASATTRSSPAVSINAQRHALVSLGELRGKALQVGGREVGEIEAVMFDPSGKPAAVIEMDEDFTGSEQKLLVALEQLQFGAGGRNTVDTSLTQADFQRAAATTAAMTEPREARIPPDERRATSEGRTTPAAVDTSDASEDKLTPTGRTREANERDSQLDPAIESTVRAIRELWNAEPALRDLGLEVKNVAGRIVLSGTVKSESLRERAKDAAERLVRGIPVDNHILIKPE